MEVEQRVCPQCEEDHGILTSLWSRKSGVGASDGEEKATEVKKLTNSTEAGLRYILNSTKVPLGCAFVVTLGLSAVDCYERHSISPLLVAPVTCVFYMLGDREWRSASNPRSLQFLAMMPFVYIILTEFVLKFRTALHTVAVWHMQPPFLALLARDVQEAGVYLAIHALLVAHLSVPNYFANFGALLLNDVVLVASVSLKDDITTVARTLLSHNRILSGYIAEACSTANHARRVAMQSGPINSNLSDTSGALQEADSKDGLARMTVPVVANSVVVAPEIQQGDILTAEELESVERQWAFNKQEPDFGSIEAMCLAGKIDADVAAWLLRRWAWAELQLQQQMEQVQRMARSSNQYNDDLDRFAQIIGEERSFE